MLFADVCDAKSSRTCELYWSPFVLPKSRDELALMVAAFVESLFEECVGQNPDLWYTVHAAISFNINHAVFGNN